MWGFFRFSFSTSFEIMLIAIAGPYNAPDELSRQKNLDRMNEMAARVYELGHIPVIGVNVALPVIRSLNTTDWYPPMMNMSLAVVERCDALLLLAESPGANRERDLMLAHGKPVYQSLEEIPRLM